MHFAVIVIYISPFSGAAVLIRRSLKYFSARHRFRSRAADAAETRVLHLLGGVEHMVPVNRIAPAFHRVAEALREQN